MKSRSIGISKVRVNYQKLSLSKKERGQTCAHLFDELPYSEVCNAVDYLLSQNYNRFFETIYGNPTPKSIENLGRIKEYHYLKNTFRGELSQILVTIRRFKETINSFLDKKKRFDSNLLLGNYSLCHDLIDDIQDTIGISLWSIENKFILLESQGLQLESKKYLSYINNNNKTTGTVKSLIHHLNIRSEKSLSINRYIEGLSSAFAKMNNSALRDQNIEYYKSRLIFLSQTQFSYPSSTLGIDYNLHIVDRYLHLVRLISVEVINSQTDKNEKDRANINSDLPLLINRLGYLLNKINDPALYKLKVIGGQKLFPAFNIEAERKFLTGIDLYTTGKYQKAADFFGDLLIKDPNRFELYELYSRSIINGNIEFNSIGHNTFSLQNSILTLVYNLLSGSAARQDTELQLLNTANNLASNYLSYGIINFVFNQKQGKIKRTFLASLSNSLANPVFSEVFSEKFDKRNYLDLLKKKYPNSITVDYFLAKLGGVTEIKRFEEKIPEGRYKIELAKQYQKEQEYKLATKIWEELLSKTFLAIPAKQEVTSNLYACYESLKKYDNCISLFVDSLLESSFLVEKIETNSLLAIIRESRFQCVSKYIDLPIFYRATNGNENEVHIALEQFLLTLDHEKPSELLKDVQRFDKERLVYLLGEVCQSDILRHSIFINSSKERLEERLTIVEYLNFFDTNHKRKYIDEMKDIQNILIIKQGLIELDDSKIYVNEQGILENQLQDLKPIFKRFKTISELGSQGKMLLITNGACVTMDMSKGGSNLEEIVYSQDPLHDVYSELFNSVKNKFLYSQFGIVAYLSTRIRHGVLVGELRPIFEKHKLITLKRGNSDQYVTNRFWESKLRNINPETLTSFINRLNSFSSNIDALIFSLIKEHLQVYDIEINPKGWFNYNFTEIELYLGWNELIEIENFEDFIRGVFQILWRRTDKNLDHIRQRIKEDTLDNLNDSLNQLSIDSIGILGELNSAEVISMINKCSTELQTCISKISMWFKRSELKSSDFTLSHLTNMVMEYVNRSNPNKKVNPTTKFNFDEEFDGIYLTHFADLFRIFIENIMKHSDGDSFQIETYEINESNNYKILVIEIINALHVDPSAVRNEIITWTDISNEKLLKEGKSGYTKALKIIKSDLKSDLHDSLETTVDNDSCMYTVRVKIDHEKLLKKS